MSVPGETATNSPSPVGTSTGSLADKARHTPIRLSLKSLTAAAAVAVFAPLPNAAIAALNVARSNGSETLTPQDIYAVFWGQPGWWAGLLAFAIVLLSMQILAKSRRAKGWGVIAAVAAYLLVSFLGFAIQHGTTGTVIDRIDDFFAFLSLSFFASFSVGAAGISAALVLFLKRRQPLDTVTVP